ncbi:MAG TPA: Fe-S cluster assembly protein SufD [Edaphocola sp.]|nr:Fe-S cluster assembly protein SufD [Edaphocola sp.]
MITKQLEAPLFDTMQSRYDMLRLNQKDSISEYRAEAMEAFTRLGFPSVKNEEWRFTNVLPIIKKEYDLNSNIDALSTINIEKASTLLEKHFITNFKEKVYKIVSINGVYCAALSQLPQQEGFFFSPILKAKDHPNFKKNFGKVLNIKENAFAALNSATFQNGAFISLDKNVIIDAPIHFIKIILADNNALIQKRDLFVLDKFAEMNIIESYIKEGTGDVFLNIASEVVVAEQAQFNHYDLQKSDEHLHIIQRTEAQQSKHSNYRNYVFTLPGAGFVRNNLSLHLDDAEIETHLYGLYLSANEQLIDNHTEVHHKFPRGESNQLYKGIMMDKSKAVFNGKIYVYQDAQKTNAFQQSNNILFSQNATVNAKPQLEIFADDVKCSHGTTIGQLDQNALFYLKSRGMSETKAKEMMVKAFAFDVVEKIEISELKTYIGHLIAEEMENR